jgi:hypothetical protein
MFRRRPGKSDQEDASAYSRRSAVADSIWTTQDRLRSGFGKAVRATGVPFEWAGYKLRSRVAWPLEDRVATMGAPARALSAAAVLLITAGAVVAGLSVAGGGPGEATEAPVAVATTPAEPEQETSEPAPAPTLQGATPVFEPTGPAGASEVDPAKAIVKSAPAENPTENEASASATTASLSAATGKGNAGEPEIDGPPAGPEAIAVARDFADAFVLYETGGTDEAVRAAFGETATPALSRALLKRPPRLPANVEVPQAKVVNVVPAPSHADVYPVSVSLLRVGATSELRLDMEQRKGEGWRVTNVLG